MNQMRRVSMQSMTFEALTHSG